MKSKIEIGIICVTLYAILGGAITAKARKEAEEAHEREQRRKQGISKVLQEAKSEDKIYHEYGDL